DLSSARAVAERLRAAEMPLRVRGLEAFASLELAEGRPARARAILGEAAALAPGGTDRHFAAAILALPFVPLDRGALTAAIAEARSLDAATPLHAALKHHTLGLLAVKARDASLAERSAAALEPLSPHLDAGTSRAELAPS